MKLGFILSLVSALQICQQSVLSTASSEFDPALYALASAAFPLGKFISTLYLAFYPATSRFVLTVDAWLLIIGSAFTAIRTTLTLCVGRFLIGCGAGLGFVAATVLLFEAIPYKKRPAHFFVLGISFAFATFLINLLQVIHWRFERIVLFSAGFSGICGVLYLFWKPPMETKDDYHCDDSESITNNLNLSKFPILLVYILMILNVTIGVPIILGFSALIFENFGNSYETASFLSVTFPIAQIILILILYFTVLDRRLLIVGGYCVAVFLQAVLLLTSVYPFLPEEHSTVALSILLWLLIVVSSVPCNTALCLIAEQFSDLSEQMKQTAKGRSVLWILATISTATFPYCLSSHGFTIAFFPYVTISAVLLLILINIYPHSENDERILL